MNIRRKTTAILMGIVTVFATTSVATVDAVAKPRCRAHQANFNADYGTIWDGNKVRIEAMVFGTWCPAGAVVTERAGYYQANQVYASYVIPAEARRMSKVERVTITFITKDDDGMRYWDNETFHLNPRNRNDLRNFDPTTVRPLNLDPQIEMIVRVTHGNPDRVSTFKRTRNIPKKPW